MSRLRGRRVTPSGRRSRGLCKENSSDEEMSDPLRPQGFSPNYQPSGPFGLPQFPGGIKLAAPNVFGPMKNEGITFNTLFLQKENSNHPLEENQANKKPENTLYNQYEEKIRPCIDLIDSLRALGVEKDLALPAIAVIGDQSSGKSSVLEALSGVALPRGSGIVTRCPLALRLKKLPADHMWKGKINYLGNDMELSNPSQVEKEIRSAQNKLAGEGVGISDKLISLEISSPDVPDLTLIDLPGIARVAVGNQPTNIGEQIKKLIKNFIDKEETVNLVVVPCNVDIATTEALKMAQEVDPEGERTLGILTKPDLIDKGTEGTVVKILRNMVIPLKKGYMIVKCRGQQDIQSNLPLASAIQKEKSFFENHKCFAMLLQEKRATVPLLAEKLTNELVHHIRKIQLFNTDINSSVQGEEKLSDNDTRLCTKIRKEFQKWGQIVAENGKNIEKSLRPEEWRFENQYRGRELPGFINYRTFESFVRKHIIALEHPAVEVLNKVAEIVRQGFTEVAKAEFEDFPHLYQQAKKIIESIKEKRTAQAEGLIRIQFEMEQKLFCQDDVYRKDLSIIKEKTKEGESFVIFSGSLDGKKTLSSMGTGINLGGIPTQGDISITEITYHLKTYFNSAGGRLSCQIPLIIQFYVLQKYGDNLQNEMLQLLQRRDMLSILLQERKDAAEQRQLLSDRIRRLTEARSHLAKFSS
nr:PREDICTED: interferon-induced GTP-binding protein Mx1 isoform X2 [Anolis carolinensis]|eukprot:XP_016847945.1 PREDICTED: interferon-induced GTP-binding protein Mx1 isoform X2 [Anolis carolinensis]